MKYENGKMVDMKISYIGGGSRGWAWTLMNDLGRESAMSGSVYLYEDFYRPSAEDNTNLGRPLCGIRKPKNIPGYIKCLHGSCPIPGTRGEQEKVQQYLERGFYYE